ncbi:MAG TPA: Flp family type IVb pilin [Actinomycetales bacterium]|jgi:pilus assembly protein Flp/PilA|nr:Flp family type IVb pilin [Actinomycetales bacterium]
MFELMYRFLLDAKRRSENSERGASAVEYGLLIAGVAALVATVVFLLGGAIVTLFNTMITSLGG